MKRTIIRIDEKKCNGCGACISNCAEGALQIINGKARIVKESLCDGLGACIGHCPQGAITIEERETEAYEQKEAEPCECPGSLSRVLKKERPSAAAARNAQEGLASELNQWPIQLHLINPRAAYFNNADLLVAADCVPFAFADFHRRFLKDRILVILCPKLDNAHKQYTEKLSAIIRDNAIKSISIVHMEVPCCFGVNGIVEEALKVSGKNIMIKEYTISLQGEIV